MGDVNTKLDEQVAALKKEVDSLKQAQTELEKKKKELETEVEKQGEEKKLLEAKCSHLEEVGQMSGDMEKDMKTLKDELVSAKAELDKAKSKTEAFDKKCKELEDKEEANNKLKAEVE